MSIDVTIPLDYVLLPEPQKPRLVAEGYSPVLLCDEPLVGTPAFAFIDHLTLSNLLIWHHEDAYVLVKENAPSKPTSAHVIVSGCLARVVGFEPCYGNLDVVLEFEKNVKFFDWQFERHSVHYAFAKLVGSPFSGFGVE